MPLHADRCGDGQKVRLARFALDFFVKITRQLDSTKLQAQIADEQQQRNADGPPLGALVVDVDVSDREVGARRVGRPAEPASNHHVLKGLRGIPARAWDVDRRAREVARKSIIVEENGTEVGGDLDVLRKRTASDGACTFLNTDYVPWSVKVSCQGTRILATCRTRVPGEDLELVTLSPAALIRTKSRTRRATGQVFQELWGRFPICVKVRWE